MALPTWAQGPHDQGRRGSGPSSSSAPSAGNKSGAIISAALNTVLSSIPGARPAVSDAADPIRPRAWVAGVWFLRSPSGGECPGDALGAFGDGEQLLAALTTYHSLVLWNVVPGEKVGWEGRR